MSCKERISRIVEILNKENCRYFVTDDIELIEYLSCSEEPIHNLYLCQYPALMVLDVDSQNLYVLMPINALPYRQRSMQYYSYSPIFSSDLRYIVAYDSSSLLLQYIRATLKDRDRVCIASSSSTVYRVLLQILNTHNLIIDITDTLFNAISTLNTLDIDIVKFLAENVVKDVLSNGLEKVFERIFASKYIDMRNSMLKTYGENLSYRIVFRYRGISIALARSTERMCKDIYEDIISKFLSLSHGIGRNLKPIENISSLTLDRDLEICYLTIHSIGAKYSLKVFNYLTSISDIVSPYMMYIEMALKSGKDGQCYLYGDTLFVDRDYGVKPILDIVDRTS